MSGRRPGAGNSKIMIADPSVALGWQLLQSGNLAAADDVAHQLLKRGLRADLVPLAGAIRLQQGRFSEAAPMFERARALHPAHARFAFLHGTALAGLQQLDAAIGAWQDAIKQDPNF